MHPRRYPAATVGTGGIAAAHAQALRGLPHRADLVAVADVDLDQARTFAERWEVPHAYRDAAELLESQPLDPVQMCTPPHGHAPLALRCLAAGATVLVDKPPTPSLAELDALVFAEPASAGHVATVSSTASAPPRSGCAGWRRPATSAAAVPAGATRGRLARTGYIGF